MTGPNLNYKTGIGVRDAIGGGAQQSILGGLLSPVAGSQGRDTASVAAGQMGRLAGAANLANATHNIASANAEQNMNQQSRRSEAAMTGLQDEVGRYSDFNDRKAAQNSFATDLYSQNLGFATGLAQNRIRGMRDLMRQAASEDFGEPA